MNTDAHELNHALKPSPCQQDQGEVNQGQSRYTHFECRECGREIIYQKLASGITINVFARPPKGQAGQAQYWTLNWNTGRLQQVEGPRADAPAPAAKQR